MALSHRDASELAQLMEGTTAGALIPEIVRRGFQDLLEAGVTAAVGAQLHQRCPDERATHRNGYRERLLTTQVGDLTLAIPKLRQGSFFPNWLEPRSRVDKALYAVVLEAYTACSFSSCFERFSSSFSRISLAGSRRQLSIDKNERKGGSDEPDAPLLLERELAVGEADVVIGGIQSDQANNAADDGFNQGLAVQAKPPPGRRQVRFLRIDIHPMQPSRKTTASTLVHLHYLRNRRGPGTAGAVLSTLEESSKRHTRCGVCFGGWKERCD